MSKSKPFALDPAFAPTIKIIFEQAKKISWLASLVSPRQDEVASISPILEKHDPRYVSALNFEIRRETEGAWYRAFAHDSMWSPNKSKALVHNIVQIDRHAAFPLMTIAYGYVREAAIQSVTVVPGPFALAMLAYRLNDWVNEVRIAATAKLAALEHSIAPETIASCAEILLDFGRYERSGPEAKVLIERLLAKPVVRALLRDEVMAGKTDRACRIFRRLLKTPALDDMLPAAAESSAHPRIRSNATRAILRGTIRWMGAKAQQERHVDVLANRDDVARHALADRADEVRHAGLEYVVTQGRSWLDYESILFEYVAHPDRLLAELAQYGLNAVGVDWLSAVRARLVIGGSPNRHIAKILAKHGDAVDGARLWEIASAMLDDGVLALLAAAAHLKNEEAVGRLSAIALEQDNLPMAKRAAKALADAKIFLPPDKLQRIADRGSELFARGLYSHFMRCDVMSQLNILARLERASVSFDFKAWFEVPRRKINRGALLISDANKSDLRALLTNAPTVREFAQTQLAIRL